MKDIALTLFPEMFSGPLGHSLASTALKDGIWSLETMNYRDFAADKHRTVDDKPYGGGTGMVLKADIVGQTIDAAIDKLTNAQLIITTPRGTWLDQAMAQELAGKDLIIACG